MKKYKYPVLGFVFFCIAVILTVNIRSLRELFPVQEVALDHGAAFGPVIKDYLFVQEITLKKRYINRVDVFLAKTPTVGASENVFLLLDGNHKILHSKRIISGDIDGGVYYKVDFNESIDIGKGKKLFVCINSIDGSMNNYLLLPRKTGSALGKLYVIPVQNNDLISSVEKREGMITFDGSMGLRTFEANTRFFNPLQILCYILAFGFALLIIFFGKIKSFIIKSSLSPEWVFLGISLVFGSFMVFITPPFQVPDEPQHLYRSYQVAEFNIFKYHDSVPQSLVQLASICDRMKFQAHEKTSKKEILGLTGIQLNPTIKSSIESPNYFVPYLPQAFGIMIGKLFNLSPLSFFYLARFFNLLVSVLLLFIAVRTTPVLKWLFFLLSILPMTVYQMSSLSYDALTISLSFLVIAIIFNFAFNKKKEIRIRDIIFLMVLAILLSACKPPYYLVVFSFLIVPIEKIGSWKKFLVIVVGLIIAVVIGSQLWSPSQMLFRPLHDKMTRSVPAKAKSLAQASNNGPQPAPVPEDTTKAKTVAPQPQPAPPVVSPFDPPAQKKFILQDPIRYIGIIWDTIGKFIGLYIISFIGLFGWVDTPLPPGIIYPYLILLFLIALTLPTPGIKISPLKKSILFSLFLIGFVLVETAMYVYCNPIGCNPITAVQGRYFIALGPLLFIIFYNSVLTNRKSRGMSHSKKMSEKEKRNQKKKTDVKEQVSVSLYTKSMPWFIVGFGLFGLLYSIYLILARFYIILI